MSHALKKPFGRRDRLRLALLVAFVAQSYFLSLESFMDVFRTMVDKTRAVFFFWPSRCLSFSLLFVRRSFRTRRTAPWARPQAWSQGRSVSEDTFRSFFCSFRVNELPYKSPPSYGVAPANRKGQWWTCFAISRPSRLPSRQLPPNDEVPNCSWFQVCLFSPPSRDRESNARGWSGARVIFWFFHINNEET